MERSVQLSESHLGLWSIYFAVIITGVALRIDIAVLAVIVAGLLSYMLAAIQFITVSSKGDKLHIFFNFRSEEVPKKNIEKVEIGMWPLYMVRVHFRHPTKFGKSIRFPASRGLGMMFGIGSAAKKELNELAKKYPGPHQN